MPEIAAAPEQQPALPAQQQAPVQAELDMSPEAIMGRAMGDDARPRDAMGRFVSGQPAAEVPAEAPPEQAAEKPAEAPAEEPAEQEEVPWDSVKDVKIKVPMKVDGKEWVDEVTIGQLREERLMKADYTRKTQEIAERERQTQTATQQAIEKERGQYLAALNTLQQTIQQAATPELANVDWDKLAAEQPAEYVRLSNRARAVNEAMQRVRFEAEKVQTQQANEQKERLAKAVEESRVKLKEAIPAWSDDLYQTILKRGVDTYGFKPEEVGQFYDHRVMRVMHDAHLYRAMQEGKPLAEKKVVAVPPVLRPGNVKPKVDARTQELQQTRSRLEANGNDIDAAAAMMGNFISKR
jgi:hypothetical protein